MRGGDESELLFLQCLRTSPYRMTNRLAVPKVSPSSSSMYTFGIGPLYD